MSGALFMGLDVGTQGTKGLLLDAESGRVVARAVRHYELLPHLPPGAAEQHPDTWIDAVGAVAHELLATEGVHADALAGVGVSGQQHGLVALDAGNQVVRPAKLWCDTSTADEARALSGMLGRHVPTGFTASKVLWLARHEPEHWARTVRVLLPHDYINLALTGECSAEAGDASGTGWFDAAARRWDEGAAVMIDDRLPDCLPPLVAAGEPAGVLHAAGAALLGLRPGVTVSTGGGDNMCAAIGSGATRPGVVVLSLGTSGTAFTYAERPALDPSGLIAGFCDSTGGWLPLLCVMNLTGVTEEVRAAFGRDGAPADLDALTRAASEVPPGCDGLTWLPYLQGERVPDLPTASGTLLGLRPGSLRPAVLFRAAMEGTSLNLAWGLQRMARLGVRPTEVRLVGGAAANPLWRSILADTLGVPVRRLVEDESAALGAALQACWTVRRAAGESVTADDVAAAVVRTSDTVEAPDPDRAGLYAELREAFVGQVGRLYGLPGEGESRGRGRRP